MRVALYKGISPVSLAIRFVTRSQYSHAAFLFDKPASRAAARMYDADRKSLGKLHYWAEGSVVEAWQGGVRNSTSLSSLHTPGTHVDLFEPAAQLGDVQEEALIAFIVDTIGWPYSYWNVLKFVTRRPGRIDGSYFCSEYCFEGLQEKAGLLLLRGKPAWAVPPDWLQMPPALVKAGEVITK